MRTRTCWAVGKMEQAVHENAMVTRARVYTHTCVHVGMDECDGVCMYACTRYVPLCPGWGGAQGPGKKVHEWCSNGFVGAYWCFVAGLPAAPPRAHPGTAVPVTIILGGERENYWQHYFCKLEYYSFKGQEHSYRAHIDLFFCCLYNDLNNKYSSL